MAKIDILVPCYRYGRFLPRCVGSVLSQSLEDFRLLIIDDASPDDSANVAARLARSDRRVEFRVHSSNRGHIATYNEGIEWASSRYFLLLSADDLLAPGALARAARILDERPDVALTYGACIEFREEEPIPPIDPAAQPEWTVSQGRDFVEASCRTLRNFVSTPTAIVRTDVQKKIGGYRPELYHAGDLEMWLRFAAHGAVATTPSVQAFYRIHGDNMSAAVYSKVTENYFQLKAAFDSFFAGDGARIPGAKEMHELVSRRLGDAAYWTAVAQLCRANMRTGTRLLRFAWKLNPDTRFWPPFGHLPRMERRATHTSSAVSQVHSL